jgi:hypothetical protein
MSALSCKGLVVFWVSTGAACPADLPVSWNPGLVPLFWLLRSSQGAHILSGVPDVPPPR